MPRQRHTVLFVPHTGGRLRKWQIGSLQLGTLVSVFFLVTLAGCCLAWSHFNSTVRPEETLALRALRALRAENSQLRQANQGCASSVRSLRQRLTVSEDRARRLALMAGLDSLGSDAEAGAAGGAPNDEAMREDLPLLEREAGQLDGLLDVVEARLEERVRWISSTPAIAPVKGVLTSGFGTRSDPLTHGLGLHRGVDIAAAPGQPVRASADGVVVLAAVTGGYGQAVYLAHGFGLSTRYGHLSEIDVKPGQRLHRGDVLGRVGSTGRSTGCHLHYEVRLDGSPVNPLAYILDNGTAGP